MIALASNTRVWLAAGITGMRKGFDGLAALVATTLESDPFSGHVFVFRGKRGDRIKLLWYAGHGAVALMDCCPVLKPKACAAEISARTL
jgi:transposase